MVRSSSSDCGQFARAGATRLNNRLLDRDHRLVGEVGDQFNLFFRKGPDLLTIDRDQAHDRFALGVSELRRGSITA